VKPGTFRVATEKGSVTATAYPAAGKAPGPTYLFAHGAGANQKHPYIVGTAERLCALGVSVVTFDFPYTEAGRKAPDRGPVLEECLRAVFDAVRTRAEGPLFAGGKSMGGRIASQVAARPEGEGIDPSGLVFLGYPLHPPGKPEQKRDKHLPKVRVPMLFVQGTRDPFGGPDEIAPYLRRLAKGSRILPIKGGDHSHAVLKRDGVPQADVYGAIARAMADFMREVR
jgi:hypothetical protein